MLFCMLNVPARASVRCTSFARIKQTCAWASPAGQSRHCDWLVPPLMKRKLPAGQAVQAVALDCAVRLEYVPGGQARQADMDEAAVCVLYVPAQQAA